MALRKIASLWKKEGGGKTKLSGKVEREGVTLQGGAKLLLFANDKGDNPKRPDFTLHVAEDDVPGDETPSSYNPPTDDGSDLPF